MGRVAYYSSMAAYACNRTWADIKSWAMSRPEADAFVTVRLRDNAVIDACNPDDPLPIASITKVRTATVLCHHGLSPETTLRLEKEDFISASPSFKQGDVLSVDALVSAMMLYSDNVAAQAISRVGCSDFIARMNEGRVGSFSNPWGGGVASAREVVRLVLAYQDSSYLLQRAMDDGYKTSVSGPNARLVQWSNRVRGRAEIPGFLWGKTGTSDFRASLAFVWEHGGEMFVSVVLRSRGNRFRDGKILVGRALSKISKR